MRISMVEVLVAAVILLTAMIPMGILLTSATKGVVSTKQREAALQLADSWVEILSNSQPPTNNDGSVLTSSPSTPIAPAGTQTPPSTLAGTSYKVTAEYSENLVNDIGQSDLCSAGEPPSPTHPGVIQLIVTVSWNGGRESISDSSEINYPEARPPDRGLPRYHREQQPGVGHPLQPGGCSVGRYSGHHHPDLSTRESGRSDRRADTSPDPYTLYPDPNGCIFVQMPVGTYNVATEQPNTGGAPSIPPYTGILPFVTDSGSTTDEIDNLNVTVTAETPVQLDPFDEGITANLSYGGASAVGQGVDCPDGASITCITTGSGSTGASAAWGGPARSGRRGRSPGQHHQSGGVYHRRGRHLRRRWQCVRIRDYPHNHVGFQRPHHRHRSRGRHRSDPGDLSDLRRVLCHRDHGLRRGPVGRQGGIRARSVEQRHAAGNLCVDEFPSSVRPPAPAS